MTNSSRDAAERERQKYREEKQKRAEALEYQKITGMGHQQKKTEAIEQKKNIEELREQQRQWLEKNKSDSPTLIDKYEEDYRNALKSIEIDVKQLIESGQEMKGLMLFSNNLNEIIEVHESLNILYSIIYSHQDVLKRFNSERLRQLGHEPIALYEQLKNVSAESDFINIAIDNAVIGELNNLGFRKEHWWIKPRILNEIEYLIESLRILIEPGFIPLESKEDKSEGSLDRYIPSPVKLAVWRRDGGKCVVCGTKEKLEYDHIIPVSKGGSNTERNVQLLCEKCNRQKAASIQ